MIKPEIRCPNCEHDIPWEFIYSSNGKLSTWTSYKKNPKKWKDRLVGNMRKAENFKKTNQ